MSDANLERRVEVLEREVTELGLLPARFDGVEGRLAGVEGRLVGVEGRLEVVEGQIVQLRMEMRDGFSAIRTDLGTAIREGDEETRRYMRVLYEDLIERIARLGEGPPRRRSKR